MHIPMWLRLLFSLAITALLMLLVIGVFFFSQRQLDDAGALVQAQQQRYDNLRRSQVLVLRLRDAAADPARREQVAEWRAELDALQSLTAAQQPEGEALDYFNASTAFSASLQQTSDAAAPAPDLYAATDALLLLQDDLLAASLTRYDAARSNLQTVANRSTLFRLVSSVVAVALALFNGWLALSWAARPMGDLARQVRRAAGSKSSVNWPDFHVEPGAPRELADLARSLNKITANLRQQSIDMEAVNLKLESLHEEVLSANRAKTAFLTTMSHELRTPLNAIIGFSEMLHDEMYGPLNERQRTQLERIMRNSQNLLTLINDVLDISRVESGKFALHNGPCDPEKVIGGVVQTIEPLVRQKGLVLQVELQRPLPQLMTDENRLLQVLVNLANNAVKFTKQGAITLGAHIDPGLPHWLVFTISDTGIGIPPDDLDHIWDEFYQVNNSLTREAGGSGLGLAIVRKLIDVLGGDVEVHSEVGAGTRFAVYMPLAPSSAGDGQAGASLYAATGSYVVNGQQRTFAPEQAGQNRLSSV